VFNQKDLVFARKVFPWMRSLGGGNLINPLELGAPDPFYMTFLREPVARVFSHYQHAVRSGNQMTFEEMLRLNGVLENLHVKLMTGERNLDKAKFFLEKCGLVGFTEKFDLSLRLLDKLSPCRLNLNYKRKQVAPDNAVKKRLENDPKMVELAREYNKLDLELYSFALQEIFPRLCEKAGVKPSESVASYDTYTDGRRFRYVSGRFYNKIFRQLCKVAG
jgi:hypothetical protein